MGKNLKEAMRMLEGSQRRIEEEKEKKLVSEDIPGPLQGSGQDMVSILQLVQNLMHGDDDEEPQSARYENGCAYFHEEEREGLAKICRLAIHSRYEDFVVDGFNVLYNKKPVVYLSAAARPGLGQYLCNQDVAFLEKLIKDDIERGRLPLLLVANAGTAAVGHTDKIGRLRELCEQYGIWLHVEGVNLATLALGYVSSSVLAATKCDSMTLTPGSWLGLPAVPAVTLYKHDDPALTLVAGLTSNKPADKLRALPLWLSLQYLGLDGIVEKIKHACQLLPPPQSICYVLTEGLHPTMLWPMVAFHGTSNDRQIVIFFLQLEYKLEGTQGEDVDELVACIQSKLPVLTCTLQLREEFKQEVEGTAGLLYVDDPNWPGIGVVRYEHANDDKSSLKSDPEGEKIHAGLLKKLNELESDLTFKMGNYFFCPEYKSMKSCIYVGMASDDIDVSELVETIAVTAREIEENSRLLENMTEVVRKGIQEAQVQLQKANEERLLEEVRLRGQLWGRTGQGAQLGRLTLSKGYVLQGVLRQIPVVGSVLNWFSPVQASQKGRTFNLTAGTQGEDVDELVACIQSKLPVLTCTLQLREEFKQEVEGTAGLLYVDDPNWPGIGVVRYEHANDDKSSLKSDPEGEKIHAGLLKKLNELESDLTFKMGNYFFCPEYKSMKSCIYVGMASDDIDVSELVETIAVTAREIEENSRLLENMTEVVRKGIQEAQVQLQKANEERLLEEGVLRQIPVVGSVLNWFSPVQASQKGRTFNLTAGSLESTEHTYVYKVQGTGVTPPPTPSGIRTKQRLPGQKPFKRSLRGSDAMSETSSVSHIEDLEKVEDMSYGPEQSTLEARSPEQPPGAPAPQASQTEALQNRAQHPEDDHPQVEELESLR
ncbi:Pyridoxal-dependent decarboxylase domain-containing protein 1 [Heterocephalus glaber]|uniref:Pyridoxal-dependent decarboxylase domain-containing protein 1 n=1 Tax=Heterocephalus glaber TaxID=10181 RepID=G5C0V9_HETGA|nr:Pyridoxal-dependent decarboxylase domain-containing protein 1 [Heterocephalus glaber]